MLDHPHCTRRHAYVRLLPCWLAPLRAQSLNHCGVVAKNRGSRPLPDPPARSDNQNTTDSGSEGKGKAGPLGRQTGANRTQRTGTKRTQRVIPGRETFLEVPRSCPHVRIKPDRTTPQNGHLWTDCPLGQAGRAAYLDHLCYCVGSLQTGHVRLARIILPLSDGTSRYVRSSPHTRAQPRSDEHTHVIRSWNVRARRGAYCMHCIHCVYSPLYHCLYQCPTLGPHTCTSMGKQAHILGYHGVWVHIGHMACMYTCVDAVHVREHHAHPSRDPLI